MIKLVTKSQLRVAGLKFKSVSPIIAHTLQPQWLAIGAARPRYFDGRFLAARDLDRDQQYFGARQTEHFRAAGAGVLNGLLASRKDDSTLLVTPGVAFTPAGSLIALQDHAALPDHDQPLELPLFEQGDTQRLDEAFGLLSTPRDVPRRRTGIYVLLARPVEFSGDPVGLYPAAIDVRRTPEDGDTIEGVAFTLAPYHSSAIDVDPAKQRSALAHHIFLDKPDTGMPSDAVPLALVRLDGGFVTWCDSWLVRREVGAAHGGIGTYVRAPRAVAEAQVQQYHAQLDDIVAARTAAGTTGAFSASDVLSALPPVGVFPAAALDLANTAEAFFPPTMPVTLAVVPEDEIGVILEEQLGLPPIDLGATDQDLATTPVAIIITAPRPAVESLDASLRSFPLRSSAVAPGRIAARSAVAIQQLALRFTLVPLVVDTNGPALAAALGTLGTIYFARLRRATGAVDGAVADITKQLIKLPPKLPIGPIRKVVLLETTPVLKTPVLPITPTNPTV